MPKQCSHPPLFYPVHGQWLDAHLGHLTSTFAKLRSYSVTGVDRILNSQDNPQSSSICSLEIGYGLSMFLEKKATLPVCLKVYRAIRCLIANIIFRDITGMLGPLK
jgi:hypothetical protein